MKTSLMLIIGFSLGFFGCSQETVVDSLQERDGLMYEGNQQEGFTGRFESYWDEEKTKKKAQANYVNGKIEGLETWWHKNGNKEREQNYINGKREGLETTWYENGRKVTINYKNGEEDGPRTWWYKNGNKESEGNYKNGEYDGVWTRWYENGQVKYKRIYKNGKIVEVLCCD